MFEFLTRGREVKELKAEVKALYGYFESLQRHIVTNQNFDSFVSNPREINRAMRVASIYDVNPHHQESIDPEYEEVTVKQVLQLLLEKMGFKIKYTAGRRKQVQSVPSQFELEYRGGFDG